jgi:hypothetical protein
MDSSFEMTNDVQFKQDDYDHIAKYPVYNFRYYLQSLGFPENHEPNSVTDLKLTIQKSIRPSLLARNYKTTIKKTICIFTFANRSSYSPLGGKPFYEALKIALPT